jgi:cytochrome P450
VLGRNSLLVLDGDRHIRERRLLSPPFHGEYLRRYEADIKTITKAALATWPVATPFAVRPRMRDIVLKVIIRVIFGPDEDRGTDRMQELLAELLDINVTLLVAVPALRRDLGPRSPWGRFVRLREQAHALLLERIRRARGSPSERSGLLGALAAGREGDGDRLSDSELRDQLITLLVAGHETTATALAWILERLSRHPRVLRRLLDSLDAEQDDGYLDAVISETLRTRPILAGTTRNLAADAEVAGYRMPAGTIIVASQVLAHVSREHYPNPAQFMPERFLGRGPDRSAFIAYGGGPHRCLGASLAQLEMRTVIRTVLERFEIRPAGRRVERGRTQHVVLAPSRGGKLVVHHRPPARG